MKKTKAISDKIITITMIICSALAIYCTFNLGYASISHRMEYLSCPIISNIPAYSLSFESVSKKEIKKQVDKLYNNPLYFYQERIINGKYGETNILLKIVTMNNNTNTYEYAFYLTHELTHLTRTTACERYCNFTAFKILYESNDEYLKNVALWYANQDMYGGITQEYSCWGQIKNYLQEKGDI